MQRLRTVTLLDVSAVAGHLAMPAALLFQYSGGKVNSLNKECHTCMLLHKMYVESVHCSKSLTWLVVCLEAIF